MRVDKPENKSADAGPLRDEKGRLLPGQSGNPGGKPKSRRIAEQTWKAFLAETDPTDPGARTRREALLATYYAVAMAGDPSVLKDAIARELGKVPDVIQQDTSVVVKIKRGAAWQP